MYEPLAVTGFIFFKVLIRAWALAARSVSEKDILPMTAWTLPPASLRNSILPAVYSLTAVVTSVVTVPALGEGILPWGPRTLPKRAILGIMSGVAMATSNSVQPLLTLAMSSSAPASMAPAALAVSMLAPWTKAMTRLVLPMPLGRESAPRTI